MRIDRHRHDESQFDLDQIEEQGSDVSGSDAMLVQTFTETTYPTSATAEFACNPIPQIDCDDTEGSTPSFGVDSSVTLYAANVGTVIPPSGTKVLASFVGGRLVFRYDG